MSSNAFNSFMFISLNERKCNMNIPWQDMLYIFSSGTQEPHQYQFCESTFHLPQELGFLENFDPLFIYLKKVFFETLVSRDEPFACSGSFSPFFSQSVSGDEGSGIHHTFFSWNWASPHRNPAQGPPSAAPHHVLLAILPSSRCTPSCSSPSPGCWLLQILTPFPLPCKTKERLWSLSTEVILVKHIN